ncbi:hypothetical protein Dimus_010666 [Dionaea muscipula]
MLGSSAVSCPASESAGVAVEVGTGESQMPASSVVSPTLSSCVCVAEQRAVMVRDGGEQLQLEELGVSGEGSEQVVEGGAGSGGMVKTAATVCSFLPCLPSLLDPVDGSCAVGCVREEVRVPQMAGEALRPQPTDGLWQPPSTSVEPVSERVEKEKGILGDAYVAQEGRGGVQACRTYVHVVHANRKADVELSFIPPVDGSNSITMEESDRDAERCALCRVLCHATSGCPAQPGVAPWPASPDQPEMFERAHVGLQIPARGSGNAGAGRTVESKTGDMEWCVSRHRERDSTSERVGRQTRGGPRRVGTETVEA